MTEAKPKLLVQIKPGHPAWDGGRMTVSRFLAAFGIAYGLKQDFVVKAAAYDLVVVEEPREGNIFVMSPLTLAELKEEVAALDADQQGGPSGS